MVFKGRPCRQSEERVKHSRNAADCVTTSRAPNVWNSFPVDWGQCCAAMNCHRRDTTAIRATPAAPLNHAHRRINSWREVFLFTGAMSRYLSRSHTTNKISGCQPRDNVHCCGESYDTVIVSARAFDVCARVNKGYVRTRSLRRYAT